MIEVLVVLLWVTAIVATLPEVWRIPGLRRVVITLYASLLVQEGSYFERI